MGPGGDIGVAGFAGESRPSESAALDSCCALGGLAGVRGGLRGRRVGDGWRSGRHRFGDEDLFVGLGFRVADRHFDAPRGLRGRLDRRRVPALQYRGDEQHDDGDQHQRTDQAFAHAHFHCEGL